MASGPHSPLMRFIRRIAAPRSTAEPADGELLARFVSRGDELAFATLVHRHGPMVFATCQSVLHDAHDAEDAFQATFLVLVRRAGTIGTLESLGGWLHGVAYRLALHARAAVARCRVQERQASLMRHTEPDTEAIWRDLRPVLHEEVERLPARYRAPFVLCYLEGKTNEEAARLLGWPKGTVLSSLARARERLRERLTRRGVALSSAVLATVLLEKAASAAIPTSLVDATVQAASGFAAGAGTAAVSAQVLAYSQSMVRSLFLARVKLVVVLLLGGAVASAGTATLAHHLRSTPAAEIAAEAAPPDAPSTQSVVETLPLPAVVKPDRELLKGSWSVIAAEQQGAAVEALKGTHLMLTAADFIVSAPRGEVRWLFRRGETRGAIKLSPDGRPRRIDLNEKGGRVLQAIYRLDGDRLTLCVADPDVRAHPPDFASAPEDRRLLLTMERVAEVGPQPNR